MRTTTLGAIMMAAALAVAADAHAQSTYVAAAAFAEIRDFGSARDVIYYGATDDSASAVAAGGGLRIGTFLHPRVSLEMSVDVAAKKTVEVSDPYLILATFPVGFARELKASTEFLTVGTTLGYHPPTTGRVHFGYRGGVAFIRGVYTSPYPGYYALADAASSTSVAVSPTAIYPPPFSTLTERRLSVGLTLGMEAAVAVTNTIAVVPDIRLTTFSKPYDAPTVFLIRPGIGVRWAF